MRFGEKCPCGCGYVESLNWRPRLMDIECDILEAENAPPELLEKLKEGGYLFTEDFTYHLTRTGKWIERLLTPVFNARGRKFSRSPAQRNNTARSKQIAAVNRSMGKAKQQKKLFELKGFV